MRKSLILTILAILGLVAARPRDASACGGPDNELIAAALVVGGAYAGTTAGMAIYDIAADDPGRIYGAAEAVVNVPLTMLFGAALLDELTPDGDWDPVDGQETALLVGFTALHAALAIHGIHTATKRRPSKTHSPAAPPPPPSLGPPGAFSIGRVRASVVAAPVSDGRSLGAGLGLLGRF